MRRLGRAAGGVGVAALIAAVTLLFWPLREPGVTGTAATPSYRPFGWYSYQPLPTHPTLDDFRRAGISVPQDLVRRRRVLSAGIGAAGLVALGGWAVARRKA